MYYIIFPVFKLKDVVISECFDVAKRIYNDWNQPFPHERLLNDHVDEIVISKWDLR